MQQTKKKESDENNIKTIQRLDRDKIVLLLENRKQGKPTLRCCCQSTGPVIDPLPPLSSSLIPWTRRLSSTDTSVVVVVVFLIIFLLRRLCRCRRLIRPVVYPQPPTSLSTTPRTCHVSLALSWLLRYCCWVRGPVLLCHHRRRHRQYPEPVNIPAPPWLETFTKTCCIFYLLNWRLCCRHQDLGLPVNTPAPPSL